MYCQHNLTGSPVGSPVDKRFKKGLLSWFCKVLADAFHKNYRLAGCPLIGICIKRNENYFVPGVPGKTYAPLNYTLQYSLVCDFIHQTIPIRVPGVLQFYV